MSKARASYSNRRCRTVPDRPTVQISSPIPQIERSALSLRLKTSINRSPSQWTTIPVNMFVIHTSSVPLAQTPPGKLVVSILDQARPSQWRRARPRTATPKGIAGLDRTLRARPELAQWKPDGEGDLVHFRRVGLAKSPSLLHLQHEARCGSHGIYLPIRANDATLCGYSSVSSVGYMCLRA